MEHSGPPYRSTTAGLGGLPTRAVDIPILAVLIALYLGAGIGHMYTLQTNLARGVKFVPSGALFGFSMARIATCVLRIVWATRPTNVSVAIAANIFVNLGIIVVYVLNILFAQRILRARQPQIGWSTSARLFVRACFGLTILAVVILVIFTPWSFYTLDKSFKQVCRDIQLASSTWLLVFCCVPLSLLALAYTLPRREGVTEHFGKHRVNIKTLVLLLSISLCLLNDGFRAGTSWMTPRPATDPAWYDSKACFYCFIFVPELIITYAFLALRVDQIFHVPDGSSGRQTYAPVEIDTSRGRKDVETQASSSTDDYPCGPAELKA